MIAIEIASKYETIKEFRAENSAMYYRIHRAGVTSDAFAHMRRIRVLQADYDGGRHCTSCAEKKPIERFYRVSGSSTRRRAVCIDCCNLRSDAWRAKNIEQARRNCRDSAKRNPESARRAKRKLRAERPEICAARDMLKRVAKIVGDRPVTRTEIALGYSARELRAHLESMFVDGMDWSNWGEWHIDHIKPVMEFVIEGITDPAIINALSNLRPLWAAENLARSRSRRKYVPRS